MATAWQPTNTTDPSQASLPTGAGPRMWQAKLARRLAVISWLALPLAVAWWHFGPGQEYAQREQAAALLEQGEKEAAAGDWSRAVLRYDAALALLPAEDLAERRRVAVAQAAARVEAGDLIEGQDKLQEIVVELEGEKAADSKTLISARHELATASYYTAWMMRLEGASREEWLPECERARQQFRMLAESSSAAGEDEAITQAFEENLEATIRLEQMDLAALRALPPPCNCNGNCSQKKRSQSRSRSRSPRPGENESEGEPQQPQDARQEVQQTRRAGVAAGGSGGS